jgi:hypothetical protein
MSLVSETHDLLTFDLERSEDEMFGKVHGDDMELNTEQKLRFDHC